MRKNQTKKEKIRLLKSWKGADSKHEILHVLPTAK